MTSPIVVPAEGLTFEDLGDGCDYYVPARLAFDTQGESSTLTVAPGVSFLMAPGASLTLFDSIGPFDNQFAQVSMAGTESAPIVFSGEDASAGSWRGLTISGEDLQATLQHVRVEHAGSVEDLAAVSLYEGRYTIENVTISDSAAVGLNLIRARVDRFADNVFAGNAGYGLELIQTLKLSFLDTGTDYDGIAAGRPNGQDGLFVSTSQREAIERVPAIGTPYRAERLSFSDDVVVEAGVTIRFEETLQSNGVLNIGAGFSVQGTADAPVIFEGHSSEPGRGWNGIAIAGVGLIEMDHFVLSGGGGRGSGLQTLDGAITLVGFGTPPRLRLTNGTIEGSARWGIFCDDFQVSAPDELVLQDMIFRDNVSGEISDGCGL